MLSGCSGCSDQKVVKSETLCFSDVEGCQSVAAVLSVWVALTPLVADV